MFPLCPYCPIPGDFAGFPIKEDQLTIRRKKVPKIKNSGKITFFVKTLFFFW